MRLPTHHLPHAGRNRLRNAARGRRSLSVLRPATSTPRATEHPTPQPNGTRPRDTPESAQATPNHKPQQHSSRLSVIIPSLAQAHRSRHAAQLAGKTRDPTTPQPRCTTSPLLQPQFSKPPTNHHLTRFGPPIYCVKEIERASTPDSAARPNSVLTAKTGPERASNRENSTQQKTANHHPTATRLTLT